MGSEMKVIRDTDGAVINIGDWDYSVSVRVDAETGSEISVVNNPLPEGATEHEEVVVTGWDGGLYVQDDPRAQRS